MLRDKADVIRSACEAVFRGDIAAAAESLAGEYPFVAQTAAQRQCSETDALRVFARDGFIDRYSGIRLVFPGTLRLLSVALPTVFPFQKNWKMSETHPAYWELFPTVDHVVPIARGGRDTEENWVTTSMLRNSAKGNWTLEELGWPLLPCGDLRQWDGMLAWFESYVDKHEEAAQDAYVRRWREAARKVAV